MSETENAPPTPVLQDHQTPKTNGSSLANVDSSKRTPFRDIANNNDSKKERTPLIDKQVVTPTRFEAVCQLDEEETWRDRTEVITKFDHTTYSLYAKELINKIIDNLPGSSNEVEGTPERTDFPKDKNFSETSSRMMDDSVLVNLDDTICLPVLDKTLDTLNIPVANSTFLNLTTSNPATPDRSDGVFETSLLSSFEKMKIKEEEAEEDIFHDASDEFEHHDDAVPEKDVVNAKADEFFDPLEMLANSLEKISVHDDNNKSETSAVSASMERQPVKGEVDLLPSGEQKENISPAKENLSTADVINDGKENKPDDCARGRFDDPEFNPFFIPSAAKAVSGEKPVATSPLPAISTAENAAVGSINTDKDSDGLKDPSWAPVSLENNTVHIPTIELSLLQKESNVPNNCAVELDAATTECNNEEARIPSEKLKDLKNFEEFMFDPFASREKVANSPPSCLGNAAKPTNEEEKVATLEKNPILENMEQLLEPWSDDVAKENMMDSPKHTLPKEQQDDALPLKNSTMKVLNKEDLFLSVAPVDDSAKIQSEKCLSEVSVNEPDMGQVENEALPLKGEYNLNILNNLDDPNCNPFATKSAVANSPVKEKSPSKSSVEVKNDPVLSESSNIVTSPKRKYEEAFLDDEDNFDCFDENEGVISHSGDEVMQPKDDVATSNALEQPVGSQEEEIVVPNKNYNLGFIDAIGDDPKFNPFTTKSAVINTPEKNVCSESNKTEQVDKKVVTEKVDSEENSKESEVKTDQDLPLDNKTVDDVKVNKCPVKNELNEEELKDSVEEIAAEPVAPSKGYNLDFLDNLDDPNFNPFATKAAVTNSPGKMSPGSTAEVNTSDSKCKATVVKTKNSASTACKDKKPIAENEQTGAQAENKKKEIRSKKFTKPAKIEHSNQEKKQQTPEDEEVVPSKGYQLDFLDALDDSNFNPFETKSAVSNSPGKAKSAVSNSPTKTKSAVSNSPTKTKSAVSNSPTKTKLAVSNSPTKTKSAVSNSPTKTKSAVSNSPTKTKAAVSNSPSKESLVTVPERQSVEQVPIQEDMPTQVKSEKDLKEGLKVNEEMKTEKSDLNPFVTKSNVLNSPERNIKDSKEKDMSSLKTSCVTSDISPPGKAEADSLSAAASDKVKASKVKSQQPKADNVKTSTPLEKHEDGELVPQNGYQFDILDHLDDPNFNPFATKSAVSNSPKKEFDRNSALDTETEKPLNKIEQNEDFSSLASAQESLEPVIGKSTSQCDETHPSQMEFDDFDKISKEASKLIADVTPSKRRLSEMRTPKVSSQTLQNDVFSPLLDSKFDEFVNARDLSQEQDHDHHIEGEEFQSVCSHTLFDNPEDLDVLGKHGTDGDKINLVRNSLFVKFDPLVSGRQSLAPYLAQQKLLLQADDDPRRASVLISFSPSPDKTLRQPIKSSSGTPARPLFKTPADETLVDTTSLNDTTFCSALNSTVVAASGTSKFNTTIISHGGKFPDDSVFQQPAPYGENMIPEHVMNEKIKNMEMVMQDKLLRQSRELEDMQRAYEQQAEESSIALSSLEEETATLRSTIQKLEVLIQNLVEQGKIKEEDKKREIALLENKYELQCRALKKESLQYQEDLKKMEAPFYDLVKKYTRLQEVAESQRRNEETLKAAIIASEAKLTKQEEGFKTVLEKLQEKAKQEFLAEKEQHAQELKRAFVSCKKAEVKIMSLTDTIEKIQNENNRLNALIDDISK